jgi:hypothetical protein
LPDVECSSPDIDCIAPAVNFPSSHVIVAAFRSTVAAAEEIPMSLDAAGLNDVGAPTRSFWCARAHHVKPRDQTSASRRRA